MSIRHVAVAALAAGLLVPHGQANASAFQLREGDADWQSNAFAGTAAKAYDAGTAWNNPAGMVLLGDDEIDSGLNYFDPGIRFSGRNVVDGKPVPGYAGGDAGPQAVTAGTEAVFKYSPDLAFGMAVETPFGLRTAYPGNFVGRYQGLVSFIENFELALSAAYRVTPQFSIGGGPVLSYLGARLTQAINVSAFLPHGGDPVVDVRGGDSYAAGYHLGAMYQFTSGFRVGLDYHSRLGQGVDGHQRRDADNAAGLRDAEHVLQRNARSGVDDHGAMDRLVAAEADHGHLVRRAGRHAGGFSQHVDGLGRRQLPLTVPAGAATANRRVVRRGRQHGFDARPKAAGRGPDRCCRWIYLRIDDEDVVEIVLFARIPRLRRQQDQLHQQFPRLGLIDWQLRQQRRSGQRKCIDEILTLW
jgi:hypothetical protein